MAIAHRYDEDDDRQLRDAGAPVADHGEPAAGNRAPGGYAGQSLAEINAQYDSAGDIAAASGTDLDQLSLHGAAPEPAHVDPVATAVAQTELERPAAAAHDDHAQDAEAGDAEGPQTGAVQHAPGGAREAAHDVPSPSALSGAAQGLQVVAAAAPAPGAAQGRKPPLSQAELHEMLEDSPAPAAAPRGNAHPLSQAELHEFLDDPAPAAAPKAPAAAPPGNAHPLSQAELHEFLDDPAPAAAPGAPAAAPRGNAHPLSQAELHEFLDDPAPAAAPKAPAAAPRAPAHPLSQAELHEFLDDPAPAAAPKAPAATPKGPAAQGNAHPLTQAELHEFLDDPAPTAAPKAPAAAPRAPAHPLSQAELHEFLDDPAPAATPKAPAAAPRGNAHPLTQAELHEFLDDPAPAAAPEAPGSAPKGSAAATSWQAAARTYNERHGRVAQFNAATGNACGSGSDADPEAIAAWQKAHGIPADGRIGPVTLGAATRVAAAPAQADATPAVAPTLAAAPAVAPAPRAVKPVPVAAPAPAVAPAVQVARPAVAAPVKPAEAPAVAAPRPAAAPSATANSFTGTDDLKKPGKDRWTSYGKGDDKTYGWDLGGTHGVKNPGGDAGNAVYAVSNVEGRYDSVQTYDAGILSFGIMQWTLHAGSLQKFLGFLKDKSGPDGRAAFQDDFAAKGIDVKPSGGQYQLSYNGKEYALGADGEGKDAIDKLVRQDKDTARKWAEIFSAAGADPRVQKAEFERAKEMYQETQGIKFTDKVVDQSLKACKKTFHAKYRDQYGKAESWMTASPKAGALLFSMRVNNPKYANAAFLKAIDAFYDAHGTDRAKWPANWGDDFGNLVEAKCKETLDTWHSEGGNEGRVEKTLRFWNKAQAGAPATTAAAPAARPAAPQIAAAPASQQPAADAKLDAGREQKLRAQYAAIMKQFVRGKIDQGEAVKSLIAYDEKLNGGKPSVEGLVLLPVLLADLVKVTLARSTAAAPASAPNKPTEVKAEPRTPARPEAKADAAPTGAKRAVTDAAVNPAAGGPAIARKLDLPGLPTVRAFLPPGGVKGTVDLFVFFHGMYAHHDAKSKSVDDPERESHMAEAVAASGRNLVALSPAAEMTKAEWPMWSALSKHEGFAQVVEQSLARLSADLGTPLSAGTISIAGHSAGGSAVGEAADQLGDAVHDVTLQDGGYTSASFLASHDKLVHWLLTGKTDKTVRVITHGDPGKVSEGNVLKHYLSSDNLKTQAAQLNKEASVSVSTEPGNADERSVAGMHLHHRLVVHGLPASRTVSVFNFQAENHYEVRNKTMGHLIDEGPNTDFATSGAPKKDAPGADKAKPAAQPAHAPKVSDPPRASDATKHTETKHETKPAAPEPTVNAASTTGSLQDLDALVAGAHNAQVSTVAQHLHDLAAKFAQLTTAKALDSNEIKADGRNDLIKDIGTLHAEVAALDHCGLEQPRLEPIKARMFRALQELSPYHSQGRNVDILERGDKERARAHAGGIATRTCNVTSLSMALEGIGKGAKDYGGDRDVVLAVAKVFHPELTAAQLVGGGGQGDFGKLEALRLPDFMELAAIAQLAKGKTDEKSIMAAASDAFEQILMMPFLRDLAKQFGVSAEIKYFSYDGKQTHTVSGKKGKTHEEAGTVEADKLGSSSKDQRHQIDALIDLRNKAEALEGGDSKKHAAAVKKYEDAKAKLEGALGGKAIENSVPLEAYKQAVIDYIGSELASGAAVETHVIGHFVRLRAIYADHVVIDDPAQAGRAHKKVLWDEARAEGLFDKRIVLRP